MNQTIPMNRKERRAAGEGKRTPYNVPLMMAVVKRQEYQREDGATMARLFLTPVTADGRPVLEDEAVDGPLPWIFESRPIMVKRPSGLITGPTLVTR